MDPSSLLAAVLAGGACHAAMVDASRIVLSADFREMCRTGRCGGYDRCWMCPPHIGEIHDLMDRVRQFPQAVLYQTIGTLEGRYDIDGMFEAGAAHARVSQQIQSAVKPLLRSPFLHLTCGGCHLCRTCAKVTGEPCRFPDKALGSMEGYGIDVCQTAAATPLRYSNGRDTVTYFGMILFSE